MRSVAHGVLQLLLPLVVVTRLQSLSSAAAFGRKQGLSVPLSDEHLPARPLCAHDFTPRASTGTNFDGFHFTASEALSVRHGEVRVFNPASVMLRNGSLLALYRVGTNTMCVGTQYGKFGVPQDPRLNVRKLGAVILHGTTLQPLGRSVEVHMPLLTAAGGDVRCAKIPQDSKPLWDSIHLQDVRLFIWGGAPHAMITVGNCEQSFAQGSTRLYIARVDPTNLRALGRPHLVVVKNMRFILFHKNWVPITNGATGLALELEIEPRQLVFLSNADAVLHDAPVDAVFESVPVVSNAAAYLWQSERGCDLRGGAPALRLPSDGAWHGARHSHVSLGLAHVVVGRDVYKHVFYTFDWRKPRLITGISAPFRLPTLAHVVSAELQADLGGREEVPPLVQFATGFVLLGDGQTLLVSFGEKDCAGGFATITLKRALASIEPVDADDMNPLHTFTCRAQGWVFPSDTANAYLHIAGLSSINDWYPMREQKAGEVSGAVWVNKTSEGGIVHDRAREWTVSQCASICHKMARCAGFAAVANARARTRSLDCYYLRHPQRLPPPTRENSAEICVKYSEMKR